MLKSATEGQNVVTHAVATAALARRECVHQKGVAHLVSTVVETPHPHKVPLGLPQVPVKDVNVGLNSVLIIGEMMADQPPFGHLSMEISSLLKMAGCR